MGKKIGILQTGRTPGALQAKHGDSDIMCRDFIGADFGSFRYYPVLDNTLPEKPTDCDAWIITGSRFGVHDKLAWIGPLKHFLQEAFDQKVKMVGLCFGHQILAEALGGSVRMHPAGPGIGVMQYRWTGASGRATKFSLNAWHFDQVHIPPDVATHIATSDFCYFAGLQYGETAISFQAHPEFSYSYMADLIAYYEATGLPVDVVGPAVASLSLPVNADEVSAKVTSFLR